MINEALFWSRVEKTDTHWLWRGWVSPVDGYGRFYVDRVSCMAHRVAFELLVGPIPEGLDIDHVCRVRACVRPLPLAIHLEPVTRRVNLLRGIGLPAQEVLRMQCPAGHPYDEANTYRYRGMRYCRRCRKENRYKYA